jgi:hypothetical protein
MATGSSMTAGLSMVTFYESMTAAAAADTYRSPEFFSTFPHSSVTCREYVGKLRTGKSDKNKLPAAAQQQHKKHTNVRCEARTHDLRIACH